MILAAIAGAYFAGGGKIPTALPEHRGVPSLDNSLPAGPAIPAGVAMKLSDDPDFALFKEGLESGIKALADADMAMGKRVDSLEAGLLETGKGMESLKKEIEGILRKPKAGQVYVQPLVPIEAERLASAFSELPRKLLPKQYGMTAETAKSLVEGGGMRELMQAFAVMSAQGVKAVLCVGASDGGPAPAWLEIEADGLTVVCKGLPMEAFCGLKDRSALPAALSRPAYVLEYIEHNLSFFGACETYRSKTY